MKTILIAMLALGCGALGCGTVVAKHSEDAQRPQADASSPDVMVTSIDASHAVDAMAMVDGSVADAGPPPVTNNQLAYLVLGQPDFVSDKPNNDGPSGSSLYYPSSVSSYGTQLWIGDDSDNRVLGWAAEPGTLDAAASNVLGQTSFSSNSDGVTQTTFARFSQEAICTDGTRLFVVDAGGNRVLMWSPIPTGNGAPATLVLGQSSWTASATGTSAASMNGPRGCATDGTHLFVSDHGNSRVLVWNEIPTAMGQAADLELGWTGFGMGAGDATLPPSASSLNSPIGLAIDAGRLFVVDAGNQRVLVWNAVPTSSGMSADLVIGQSDFGGGSPNAGEATVSADGFDDPNGIAMGDGSLFVSDAQNHRVVVFTPVPTAMGARAAAVLGQTDLVTSTAPTAPSQSNFSTPEGMTVAGNRLWVVDGGYSRAVAFTLGE